MGQVVQPDIVCKGQTFDNKDKTKLAASVARATNFLLKDMHTALGKILSGSVTEVYRTGGKKAYKIIQNTSNITEKMQRYKK